MILHAFYTVFQALFLYPGNLETLYAQYYHSIAPSPSVTMKSKEVFLR